MVEIEASDVVKLILQFLKENNLTASLHALSSETNIHLDVMDNPTTLYNNIITGNWSLVLETMTDASISIDIMSDVYEHIFKEMLAEGEIEAARVILRQTDTMVRMKEGDVERYLSLENAMSEAVNNEGAFSHSNTLKEQREALAKRILANVKTIPGGRLLTLLGRALEDENVGDTLYDIFRGQIPMDVAQGDTIITTLYKQATLSKGSHAECAAFSVDGKYFILGLADGFMEVWNWATGQIRTDLTYQQDTTTFMVMPGAVICVEFQGNETDVFACGTSEGDLGVWRVSTGRVIKRILKAHGAGITSLQWSDDAQTLLTTSYDCTARLFGVKSGRVLKEFRGHQSHVNKAAFTPNNTVTTISSDGSVKIWNANTAQCIKTLHCIPDVKFALKTMDCNFVAGNNSRVFQIREQRVQEFRDTKTKDLAIVALKVSRQHKYLYALTENGLCLIFGFDNSAEMASLQVTESEVVGACFHPSLNVMVTFDVEGVIKFWK